MLEHSDINLPFAPIPLRPVTRRTRRKFREPVNPAGIRTLRATKNIRLISHLRGKKTQPHFVLKFSRLDVIVWVRWQMFSAGRGGFTQVEFVCCYAWRCGGWPSIVPRSDGRGYPAR